MSQRQVIRGHVLHNQGASRLGGFLQKAGQVAREVGHTAVDVLSTLGRNANQFQPTEFEQPILPVEGFTEQSFQPLPHIIPQQAVMFRPEIPVQQIQTRRQALQSFQAPEFSHISNAAPVSNGSQTLQSNLQDIFQPQQSPSLFQDQGQLIQQPQAELPIEVTPQRAFQAVQEDPLFTPIQQFGARPISDLDRLQLDQQRQQAQAYQQAAQHVLRQAAQPQHSRPLPVQLPKAKCKGENLWKKVHDGEPLTDKDLKQLFHSVDLTQYQADESDPMVFAFKKAVAIEAVVNNQLQHLETDEHGNPLVHGVPVDNPREWLKRDLEHFYEHDTHLSPRDIRAESGSVAFDTGFIRKDRSDIKVSPVKSKLRERLVALERYGLSKPQLAHLINKHDEWDKRLNAIHGTDGQNLIDWYFFADIVDAVAHDTKSDEEFRLVLWMLFGTEIGASQNQYLDSNNKYLPTVFHNADDISGEGVVEEQMHHYLGGVTGNLQHSHLYNRFPTDFLFESKEFFSHGRFNTGDFNLFKASQSHRDEFIKGNQKNEGRFTVGKNIKTLLLPKGKK